MGKWEKPVLTELGINKTKSGGSTTLLDDVWLDDDGHLHGTQSS